MIKNILLFGLGLFVLYNIVLFLFPIKKEIYFTNTQKAEQYVYSDKHYSLVCVGSSLSGPISKENLQRNNFFNLSFPYYGSCFGVEIIYLSGKIPDTILIEANHISRGFGKKFTDDLFNPFLYRPRFIFPFLQEKNKFFPFVIEKLKPSHAVPLNKEIVNPEFFAKLMDKARVISKELPDTVLFNKDLQKLKERLDYFASKGCKIIFYEMPIEKELENYPATVLERNMVKNYFTDKKFTHLPLDTINIYKTGDGNHLLAESFEVYNHFLHEQISKLSDK
ncbi:MAG: hypothetical protein HY305_04230 [Sphingobacteriales bacterium]|nr:hypothetical protein [Sphingobacteriales bacterium]